MEGKADLAAVGTNADVRIKKVVAGLGVLDWAFASAGHYTYLESLNPANQPAVAAVVIDQELSSMVT
jgi:hypothetical protein